MYVITSVYLFVHFCTDQLKKVVDGLP